MYPTDRLLLGMHWKGKTYVDTALPFGLPSVPKIFNAAADALQWRGFIESTTSRLVNRCFVFECQNSACQKPELMFLVILVTKVD